MSGWKGIAAACAAGALFLPFLFRSDGNGSADPRTRPNILLIQTDDQRVDMMQKRVVPHIRRLFGDEGIRFSNAVVTTSQCCPSRASIFSGRYVHNHGVVDNSPADEPWDEDMTIQKELRDEGYLTAISGKYMIELHTPPHFDRYAVHMFPQGEGTGVYGTRFNVNGEVKQVDMHSTAFTRRKALRFLEEFENDDDAPWFIQVAPYAPHQPATPPPRYQDAPIPRWRRSPAVTEERIADKPAYVEREHKIRPWKGRKIRAKFLRSMMPVDVLVRDLFRWLEEHGEADNTLAFFISDNGYMLGEHGLMNRKQVPYEESVRVPLYLRWPAEVDGGAADRSIVANVDIAPTVYEAAGIAPDYTVDGRSLLSDADRRRILIEGPTTEDTPPWVGFWTPRRVYVRYDDGEREFYDLVNDPYQLVNLLGNATAADDPDTARWDALLDAAATCSGPSCP